MDTRRSPIRTAARRPPPATSAGDARWRWSRFERALADALAADAQRRDARHALRRALAAFRAYHPRWAESGVDADLLAHRDGAAALAERDAAALARAWTQRFRYRDERQRERDVRRLEPVTRHLLELLRCEERQLGVGPAPRRSAAGGGGRSAR